MTLRAEPPVARRADAERNREKILTAARAAFAELGADISMSEISRRAGVGMAIIYRNFPGAGRPLLVAAHYNGEVRDDVALEQVLDMIAAIATIHGDLRYLRPILLTALDGLLPPN